MIDEDPLAFVDGEADVRLRIALRQVGRGGDDDIRVATVAILEFETVAIADDFQFDVRLARRPT